MAVGLGFGAFVAGMLLLAVVLGCALVAGLLVARRVAPQLGGLEAGLAWALCAAAALLLAHAVPLTLGVLGRGSVLAASVLVAAGALAWSRRARRSPTSGRVPAAPVMTSALRRDDGMVRPVAWAAALLVAGAGLAYLRTRAGQPVVSTDALSFQVPQVVRWMQTGSLWQLDQFFPDYSNATYPQHGNLLLLAVVLPFHSAFLVRLVAVPFAVMMCAGVYACAREIGATRSWALLASAAVAAIPVVVKVAIDGAQTDPPMLAFVVVGALFMLRHRRTGARSDLALAGLGLGLALGTKWYALTTLPVLGAVWVVARLVARVPLRRVAADAGVLVTVVLAAGGLWLVRNWVQTGNPLFPQALWPFDAPRDVLREQAGFTLAHYLFDGSVWSRYLRPQFDLFFAAPGYLLAAAPLAALVVAVRWRAGTAIAVATTALLLLAAYAVTPYSAFGPEGAPVVAFASTRYGLPALLAGAVATAWLGTRLRGPARPLVAVALLVAVVLGVREEYRSQVGWAAVAAAVVALGAVAWAARRTAGWSGSGPIVARNPDHPRAGAGLTRRSACAAALVVVVGVAGAALVRDRGLQRGYAETDPVFAWIERYASHGRLVGLAGAWSVEGLPPALPAFGPRLGNRVEYAGPFVEHMLRRSRTQAAFTARLRARRYDVLIVGREGPAPELGWARAAGYSVKAASPRFTLLVRGGS